MANPQNYIRGLLLIRVVAVLVFVGTLVWALLPARIVVIDEIVIDAQSQPTQDAKDQLSVNSSVFDLVLWHVPPPTEQPRVTEPVRVVRVSLQLMAITTSQDEAGQPVGRAVIYDPVEDQLYSITLGQSLSGYTLTEINSNSVSLRSGNRVVQLELDPDGDA